MIVLVALTVALAAGVDPRRLALLAGAVYLPFAVACLVVLVVWKSRPEEDSRHALFCEGVASELRAGASLRSALVTAASSVGISIPSGGTAISAVAAQLAQEFPAIGDELRLTVVHADRSGSDTAALFDEIGALAMAQSEIRREVRTATAPGRATALMLVVAPLVFVGSRFSGGSLGVLLASPQQRYVAALGLGLFLVGLAGVTLVVSRAGR